MLNAAYLSYTRLIWNEYNYCNRTSYNINGLTYVLYIYREYCIKLCTYKCIRLFFFSNVMLRYLYISRMDSLTTRVVFLYIDGYVVLLNISINTNQSHSAYLHLHTINNSYARLVVKPVIKSVGKNWSIRYIRYTI